MFLKVILSPNQNIFHKFFLQIFYLSTTVNLEFKYATFFQAVLGLIRDKFGKRLTSIITKATKTFFDSRPNVAHEKKSHLLN